jgi:hypothetical protein
LLRNASLALARQSRAVVGGIKIGNPYDEIEKTFGPPDKLTNWEALT